MAIKVETPPSFNGQSEEQLKQVISYLYRLSENLNVALNNLTSADIKVVAAESKNSGGIAGAAGDQGKAYNELKALIVNTAYYVEQVEDKLIEEFESKYVAKSEFGTFQENIGTTIETTAAATIASYNYDSRISDVEDAAAGFAEYQLHTEGFIRQGFIDYDEQGVPILGIAIGQGLKSVKVTIDGREYEQFDRTQNCAFYTASRVSFRINGQEVAYISNRKLYIQDAEINNTLTIGGKWLVSHAKGGLTFKWIGG